MLVDERETRLRVLAHGMGRGRELRVVGREIGAHEHDAVGVGLIDRFDVDPLFSELIEHDQTGRRGHGHDGENARGIDVGCRVRQGRWGVRVVHKVEDGAAGLFVIVKDELGDALDDVERRRRRRSQINGTGRHLVGGAAPAPEHFLGRQRRVAPADEPLLAVGKLPLLLLRYWSRHEELPGRACRLAQDHRLQRPHTHHRPAAHPERFTNSFPLFFFMHSSPFWKRISRSPKKVVNLTSRTYVREQRASSSELWSLQKKMLRRSVSFVLLLLVRAQVFVVELDVDGVSDPIAFMRNDNLTFLSSDWAQRHGSRLMGEGCVGKDAVSCMASRVEASMREQIESRPVAQGEEKGCPAFLERKEPPALIFPEVRRAALRLSSKKLILTMVSGGYADFGVNWARSLERCKVSAYLLVALDNVAFDLLSPGFKDHVVGVKPFLGKEESAVEGAGLGAAENFGTEKFRKVTSLKASLLRDLVIGASLDVLYADADVAFLQDPWPFFPTCSLAIQPVQMHSDLSLALEQWETSPRNPRPRAHYFGKVTCSGLVFARSNDTVAADVLSDWERNLLDDRCGGDQAALEAAFAASPHRHHICGLPLTSFPHGMALRDMEQHLLARQDDKDLAAIHFNFVIGPDAKRQWMTTLGLWFEDDPSYSASSSNNYSR